MNDTPIRFPLGQNEFLERHFEADLLHIPSALTELVYSWARFGQDFYGVDPALGTVRMFRDHPLDRARFQRAEQFGLDILHSFDAVAIERALDEGATLVVNQSSGPVSMWRR